MIPKPIRQYQDWICTLNVYECKFCKDEIHESYPKVIDENTGEVICWDCAYIHGYIKEEEYLKVNGYTPKDYRAVIYERQVILVRGKAPWERTSRDRECKAYQDWRKAVFVRDQYTCKKCGKVGGTLNAHHIKTYKDFPELRYEISNGQTLCEQCHRQLHKELRLAK